MMPFLVRRVVARRRRARRDAVALRHRAELRMLVERAIAEAQFRSETARLLRLLAQQSPVVGAAVAIGDYGVRAWQDAS